MPALIIRGSLIAGLTLKYKKIEEDEFSEHGVWAVSHAIASAPLPHLNLQNDPDASSESFLPRDPMTTAAFNCENHKCDREGMTGPQRRS